MKVYFSLLVIVVIFAPIVSAKVSLTLYETDGNTPFDCNNGVMIGAKVSILVSSDSNDYWSGGLFVNGNDREFGTLYGRDYDSNDRDWTSSHLEDAGDFAKVTQWRDSAIWGFDLLTFYPIDGNSANNSTIPGEWFIIDYEAEKVGDCNIWFYDYNDSWEEPNDLIQLFNIPTRDFDSNGVINFFDYSVFSSEWNSSNCNDPNWCNGTDLDFSGYVDESDLKLFADYWLWGTPVTESNESNEPNDPNVGISNDPEHIDPNIMYYIVDAYDNNEITINTYESIRLYVKMVTTQYNNVRTFNIEVDISDANLGSIDNATYNPYDPNASTAEILAEPRIELVDYWGPGIEQEEGIEFFATAYPSDEINDGNLASFIFTCEGEGDVTLDILNWESYNTQGQIVYPRLVNITIHQVDPNTQQMQGEGGGEDGQEESTSELNVAETVIFLEELWTHEQIQETYTEEEWQAVIDDVNNYSGS